MTTRDQLIEALKSWRPRPVHPLYGPVAIRRPEISTFGTYVTIKLVQVSKTGWDLPSECLYVMYSIEGSYDI